MSVTVSDPSASATLSTSFLSPRDRTRAKAGTTAVLLAVSIGLVLFAVGGIYLNYLAGATDLPFLGQFIGS